jgi:hypothetical protein
LTSWDNHIATLPNTHLVVRYAQRRSADPKGCTAVCQVVAQADLRGWLADVGGPTLMLIGFKDGRRLPPTCRRCTTP